jgi:phosphonate transport system substrate-binding protein
MRGSNRVRGRLAVALLAALAATACYQRTEKLPVVDDDAHAGRDDLPPLSLCIVPTRVAREAILRYQPVAEGLTARLGRRVEVRPAATWSIALARLEEGSADLAILGAVAWARGRRRLELTGLARVEEEGETVYRGALVVRPEDPCLRVQDLRGRKLGLVDAESTTGGLLPLAGLLDAGLRPEDLGPIRWLGRQEAVIRAVRLGQVDAGAVRESSAERNAIRGLRILWKSPAVPGPVLAARPGLPADVAAAAREELLGTSAGFRPADAPAGSGDVIRFRPVEDGDDAEVDRLLVRVYGESAYGPAPAVR